MREALLLAAEAEIAGEVPVGAILVRDGRIIGRGRNGPISAHDATAHAEIVALRDAGRTAQNYRLPDTTLYVTLEPCVMCAGAIIHARVKRIVFGAFDPKGGAASVFNLLPPDARFNHRLACRGGLLEEECACMLRDFFRRKRGKGEGGRGKGEG